MSAQKHLSNKIRNHPRRTNCSRILFKQGQAAAALEFLEKAIAQKPLDSESRFLRARICRQLGRAKDAAREFAEVEQLKAKEREREDVQNRRP